MKKIHFFVALLLMMTSCLGEPELQKRLDQADSAIKDYLTKNNLNSKAIQKTAGIYYIPQTVGTGKEVSADEVVEISYSSYLLNGLKFAQDTSYSFQPKTGAFFAGIAEGVTYTKVGEKAQFILSPNYAFGSSGGALGGVNIPAYSPVRVDVEVKASRNENEQRIFEEEKIKKYLAAKKLTAIRSENGIYYVVTQVGTGDKPKEGNSVTVKYTGKFLTDSNFDTGNLTIVLGARSVIQGWEQGIPLMKNGEKGILLIPSFLAYGASGNNGIPPYTPLVFEMELLRVQ
ncbi:MAG: hypothetical protein EAZ97_03700 [Bacteroidetes bacterium]|nr:MAG: hypothetical protein EAZ97_03700 [Bacteroidota bacterium]